MKVADVASRMVDSARSIPPCTAGQWRPPGTLLFPYAFEHEPRLASTAMPMVRIITAMPEGQRGPKARKRRLTIENDVGREHPNREDSHQAVGTDHEEGRPVPGRSIDARTPARIGTCPSVR